MKLSREQLQTLRHMLGIDKPDERNPEPCRDYFCASRGDKQLAELARLNAVRLYRQDEHYDWYTTTEFGRAAAIASHRSIRQPKRKRIYARYLSVSDAVPDLTFHEFLTSSEFAKIRASA